MITDIKLTPEFKAQTTKAVMSIVLFVIVYLLIILMTLALTILCIYGAIMLIVNFPRLITIILGIGLGSVGILLLMFLFKFIFKSHKADRSHLLEITRSDEPELFKLIDDIVEEVDTTFPKKVYLSSDVNASVFYDSNFWSMFFPIRKNLQIGLGLVNCVSEEELKSILAHEFGHFSQKTMKVGSYVYNVNQVIFNLLFDNEGYDSLIQRWANVSGYFAIFAVLASNIIEGIKWILVKMYGVVNKSYMGLSREMEFHADEIAANVTGYEPLKNALLRLEFADFSYNSVLSFYETKVSKSIRSENLFKEHSFVMNHLANKNEIPIKNNLPQVTIDEFNKFDKSKLVIKDQWASHPSTEERIKRLELLDVPPPNTEYNPANTIFKNIEEIQKKLTERKFKEVIYKEKVQILPFDHFQKDFQKEQTENSFSKIYNGYYNSKNIIPFELDDINTEAEGIVFDDLFSKQKNDLIYMAIAIENDLEILKQISEKNIQVKTFDYDGKKYKRNESKKVISTLEKELEKLNEQIKQNDIEVFKYFKAIEKDSKTDLLEEKYKRFFEFENEFNYKVGLYANLSNKLQFLHRVTPFEEIRNNFLKIEPLEIELKKEIKEILNDNLYQEELTEEIKDNFNLYLPKRLKYFENEIYFEENLMIFQNSMNAYVFLLSRGFFLLKKELLDYQEELLKKRQTYF